MVKCPDKGAWEGNCLFGSRFSVTAHHGRLVMAAGTCGARLLLTGKSKGQWTNAQVLKLSWIAPLYTIQTTLARWSCPHRDGSSHISYCNKHDSPQMSLEAYLPRDSRVFLADNELWPSLASIPFMKSQHCDLSTSPRLQSLLLTDWIFSVWMHRHSVLFTFYLSVALERKPRACVCWVSVCPWAPGLPVPYPANFYFLCIYFFNKQF